MNSEEITQLGSSYGWDLIKNFSLACRQARMTEDQKLALLNNPRPVFDLVAELFHSACTNFSPMRIRFELSCAWILTSYFVEAVKQTGPSEEKLKALSEDPSPIYSLITKHFQTVCDLEMMRRVKTS